MFIELRTTGTKAGKATWQGHLARPPGSPPGPWGGGWRSLSPRGVVNAVSNQTKRKVLLTCNEGGAC